MACGASISVKNRPLSLPRSLRDHPHIMHVRLPGGHVPAQPTRPFPRPRRGRQVGGHFYPLPLPSPGAKTWSAPSYEQPASILAS
jgi:hypothetical protein